MEVDGMSGMPRMTVSAPREVLREFVWLCHRRGKSASEVVREFIEEFVDSRFAEIDARDSAQELILFDDGAHASRDELAPGEWVLQVAAALRTAGCDP
jgi:Arc/MetJ-type ribon-helix-helix transcriptional regulator